MTEVVIAGIGQMPVGEHYTSSLRDLALDAIELALQGCRRADAGYPVRGEHARPGLSRTRRTWAR